MQWWGDMVIGDDSEATPPLLLAEPVFNGTRRTYIYMDLAYSQERFS